MPRRHLFSLPLFLGLAFLTPISLNDAWAAPSISDGASTSVGHEPDLKATVENFQNRAQTGDVAQLRRMTAQNPSLVNARNDRGVTALHLAMLASNSDAATFLIEQGADVNAADKDGDTPLHWAVKYHQEITPQILALLVSHSADVNCIDSFNTSPLRLAVANYDQKSTAFLVAHGAHDNTTPLFDALAQNDETRVRALLAERPQLANDSIGNISNFAPRLVLSGKLTPLHAAVLWNHPTLVQLLLAAKANLEAHDLEGQTPLHICALLNEPAIATLLLDAGADPDAPIKSFRTRFDGHPYETGQTPLHLAAENGSLEMAGLLLQRGAQVDARTIVTKGIPSPDKPQQLGSTPLLNAVRTGHVPLVALLLSHGAKPNGPDGSGEPLLSALMNCADTGIYRANKSDSIAIAKLLIQAKANANARSSTSPTWLNADADTALTWAVLSHDAALVQQLIAAGADVNAATRSGLSPLHLAIQQAKYLKDNVNAIPLVLLSHGARVNARDAQGRTPLFVAVEEANLDMARQLLNRGADVNTKNASNQTPLQYAFAHNDNDIVALLRGRGASNPKVSFFDAITKGDERTVAAMLKTSPSLLAARSSQEHTALTTALENNQKAIAVQLLAHGANVESRSWGEPELFAAVNTGDLFLVRLVLKHGAKINERSAERYPVLFRAIANYNSDRKNANLALIQTLLRAGADVNQTDDHGQTALHICVDSMAQGATDTALTEALLRAGAQVNARDKNGKTPLALARSRGRSQVADVLARHGAKL